MADLSPHFSLAELTRSTTADRLRLANTPTQDQVANLEALAAMLERIRTHLSNRLGRDCPVVVTSAFRSPAVNKAVGGVTSSDHISGQAADILAPAFGSPREVALALKPGVASLGIGQLILERVGGRSWVHVSTRTPLLALNKILTITDAGPVPGIQEA